MAETFRAIFREAKARDEYWEEWAINDFTEELVRRMDELGLSRSALASKLRVSPAYITKVLRGSENFTLRSMTRLARAVGAVVRVHLATAGSHTRWLDVVESESSTDSGAQMATAAFGDNASHRAAVVAPQKTASGASAL